MTDHDIKIVLLNGPPGSGKDYTCRAIEKHFDLFYTRFNVKRVAFADVLKQWTHRAYGLKLYAQAYENCKDQPHDDFLGRTPRECYIHMSEHYLKPLHGRDFFAEEWCRYVQSYLKMLDNLRLRQPKGWDKMNETELDEAYRRQAERLGPRDETDIFVSTDTGFAHEAAHVIERYGTENVALVEIEREGTSFANDSRSYILDDLPADLKPDLYLRTVNRGENHGTEVTAFLEDWLGKVPPFTHPSQRP